ncbi:hypothetical protein EZV62_006910 [Acer yangbiense]|uniref:Large ribosomal subunit protein mL45 n=1 Tax=Acer yangbiense TaxID=1000413 RepID=A0A5C7I8T6_9ROSI|nr:hypothetical protein EZV62_006910 [Acer yangbiense]
MSLLRRLSTIRTLYRTVEIQESSYLLGSSRSYSRGVSNAIPEIYSSSISSCLYKGQSFLPWTHRSTMTLHSTMAAKSLIFSNDKRLLSTQAKVPPQARQMGALKVFMLSPGFIHDPYAPREPIPFWRRWFTRNGWKRTKEDIIIELRSAYAISKLRKTGYNKQNFYKEAADLYKEINTLMANGDKSILRKAVTEKMYSVCFCFTALLHSRMKLNKGNPHGVMFTGNWLNRLLRYEHCVLGWQVFFFFFFHLFSILMSIIGVDRNDLSKAFIQLTLEFLTKQKFEAYDSKGAVVAGDKTKEILVRDIWVLEKSMFHPGSYWRLCGRIKL